MTGNGDETNDGKALGEDVDSGQQKGGWALARKGTLQVWNSNDQSVLVVECDEECRHDADRRGQRAMGPEETVRNVDAKAQEGSEWDPIMRRTTFHDEDEWTRVDLGCKDGNHASKWKILGRSLGANVDTSLMR